MRHITSRIRAAIGAAMIVAFASPVAAQNPRPRAEARVEARWMDGRGAGRLIGWRMARARMAGVAWHRGYARGFAAGRHPFRAMAWRGASCRGFARARLYGRFWERRRLGRMGGRWAI